MVFPKGVIKKRHPILENAELPRKKWRVKVERSLTDFYSGLEFS